MNDRKQAFSIESNVVMLVAAVLCDGVHSFTVPDGLAAKVRAAGSPTRRPGVTHADSTVLIENTRPMTLLSFLQLVTETDILDATRPEQRELWLNVLETSTLRFGRDELRLLCHLSLAPRVCG